MNSAIEMEPRRHVSLPENLFADDSAFVNDILGELHLSFSSDATESDTEIDVVRSEAVPPSSKAVAQGNNGSPVATSSGGNEVVVNPGGIPLGQETVKDTLQRTSKQPAENVDIGRNSLPSGLSIPEDFFDQAHLAEVPNGEKTDEGTSCAGRQSIDTPFRKGSLEKRSMPLGRDENQMEAGNEERQGKTMSDNNEDVPTPHRNERDGNSPKIGRCHRGCPACAGKRSGLMRRVVAGTVTPPNSVYGRQRSETPYHLRGARTVIEKVNTCALCSQLLYNILPSPQDYVRYHKSRVAAGTINAYVTSKVEGVNTKLSIYTSSTADTMYPFGKWFPVGNKAVLKPLPICS